jgi:shikimate 5-dehydrogenase
MYAKELTLFLKRAQERQMKAVDGRAMLMAQGALAIEWWLHTPAPRQAMLEALN